MFSTLDGAVREDHLLQLGLLCLVENVVREVPESCVVTGTNDSAAVPLRRQDVARVLDDIAPNEEQVPACNSEPGTGLVVQGVFKINLSDKFNREFEDTLLVGSALKPL